MAVLGGNWESFRMSVVPKTLTLLTKKFSLVRRDIHSVCCKGMKKYPPSVFTLTSWDTMLITEQKSIVSMFSGRNGVLYFDLMTFCLSFSYYTLFYSRYVKLNSSFPIFFLSLSFFFSISLQLHYRRAMYQVILSLTLTLYLYNCVYKCIVFMFLSQIMLIFFSSFLNKLQYCISNFEF